MAGLKGTCQASNSNGIAMCAKCKTENSCGCECREHLAVIQGEFYPFDIIKINCDACEHVLKQEN